MASALFTYSAALIGRLFNDAPVKHSDVLNMGAKELQDERTRLIGVTEAFDLKGDKLTDEDQAAYAEAVDRMEAVCNAIQSTAEGLKERRDALLAHNRLANVSRGLNFDPSQSISTRPAWEDDTEKFGFRDQRDFLNSVVNLYKSHGSQFDPRLKKSVANAVGNDEFTRADWEAQGIMIPRGFISSVIQLDPEADQLTSLMTRIPMTAPTVDIPSRVDKDHSTSVTGGFRVYRAKETAAPDLSRNKMELISLKAHEIFGAAAVTNQLLRDSPVSIASIIDQGLRQEARSYRIDELINGNGIGRPLGMLNSGNDALLTVLRKLGQAATDVLTGENIIEMRSRVWGYENSVWLVNQDLYELLFTLVIESPNNAGLVKVFSPGTGPGMPDTLLGRPVIYTEYINGISSGTGGNIADWGDNFISCVNPSQVYFGERGGETMDRSIHVRFLEREEVFLFTSQDDARPSWLTVLTPKNGRTKSPFVTLSKTAAT